MTRLFKMEIITGVLLDDFLATGMVSLTTDLKNYRLNEIKTIKLIKMKNKIDRSGRQQK